MENLLGKIVSIVVGAIAGFVAARVKWSIEKEKLLMEERRSKIRAWRQYIRGEFDQLTFHETVVYSEMRSHLSSDTRGTIEGGDIVIRLGRGGNVVQSLVLDDLAELEKKWGLI